MSCNIYVNCDDKHESWESLFKRLIVEQPDGSLAIRTTCCDAVTPPTDLALLLTWDSIANVPVADASSVSDWNTFFGLPVNGTPFTSVTVDGDTVKLYGGSGITLTNGELGYACGSIGGNLQLFEGNAHIVSIDDQAGTVVAIADACFYPYDLLCETTLTNLITAKFPACLTIGNYSFTQNSLIVNYDFSSVTTIGINTFDGCTSFISPDFSSLTTAGDGSFSGCTSLKKPDFSSLTVLNTNMVFGCTALESPDFSSVTSIPDSYFLGFTSLVSPDFSSVITIAYSAFSGCTSLTTINIPLCTDLGGTTGDDLVFAGITGLTITVTCDASLLTCNLGAPDGDLCYLAANNTVTVNGAPLTGCP